MSFLISPKGTIIITILSFLMYSQTTNPLETKVKMLSTKFMLPPLLSVYITFYSFLLSNETYD